MICLSGKCDRALQDALLAVLGKPKEPVAHVDMAKELGKVHLDTHFPCVTWPASAAV